MYLIQGLDQSVSADDFRDVVFGFLFRFLLSSSRISFMILRLRKQVKVNLFQKPSLLNQLNHISIK